MQQGEPFGLAKQSFFSLTSSFDLFDLEEATIASSRARLIALGTEIEVFEPTGEPIGSIEEEIFRIFPWCEYKLFDREETLIAVAKMDLFGTEFQVTHPENENEVYATIERPLIRLFRDTWNVKIHQNGAPELPKIDPRLLILIAVYQTDKDNRDYYRNLFIDQITEDLLHFENLRIDNF